MSERQRQGQTDKRRSERVELVGPEPERTTAFVVASSNIIALMLSEQRIASLSTRLPSSKLQLRADRTMHMSHMLILHARKWARLNGEPYVHTHTFDITGRGNTIVHYLN